MAPICSYRIHFPKFETLVCLLHGRIKAGIHTSPLEITQLVLEVEVTKVARWAVGTGAWGLEAGISAPARTLFCRANVLRDSRVEISAGLDAICDVTEFIVGARGGTALFWFSEATTSIDSRCLRVSARLR